MNFPYTRLIVVGTTSSGKSTLSENLAVRLKLKYVELDALYWQPNWVGTPDDEFAAKVERATRGERWVMAGNYSRTRPITWARAEAVIWLDYSFPVFRPCSGDYLRALSVGALHRKSSGMGIVKSFGGI